MLKTFFAQKTKEIINEDLSSELPSVNFEKKIISIFPFESLSKKHKIFKINFDDGVKNKKVSKISVAKNILTRKYLKNIFTDPNDSIITPSS
jgi:hypothetical protein